MAAAARRDELGRRIGMTQADKSCFVIMPFGDKKDADGKIIDFDSVYERLIKVAITGQAMRAAGGQPLKCIRCDEIAEAGWVHRQMISHILDDDVAIVDLSTLNPNVFYELGVRHALRQAVTVLLCRKGTNTPFNIQGFKCIRYDPDDQNDLDLAQREIAQYVASGLNGQHIDSLVYEVLKERKLQGAAAERLDPEKPYLFKVNNVPKKRIGVLTGDLRYVKEKIDIWVNSENTNMQMARFFERSGSAVIRYFGAKRDITGQVVEDTIAEELTQLMGSTKWVQPGTVLVTSAGALQKSHGVKRIFHVAAVQGQLGVGYGPVPDVGACVRSVLEMTDSPVCAGERFRSILFPLLGTGTAGADLKMTVRRLIDAAINYFERRPTSSIATAYFLAFTDHQRDACLAALRQA
ncbi:MAG: macro domain-containing protein, partial [Bdellovibrionaceae bacterium]|nr:macro domain-containing protein [Pseudobdellovibrionaceae bacterium]